MFSICDLICYKFSVESDLSLKSVNQSLYFPDNSNEKVVYNYLGGLSV